MDEQLMAWATSRPEVIAQPSNSTPFSHLVTAIMIKTAFKQGGS